VPPRLELREIHFPLTAEEGEILKLKNSACLQSLANEVIVTQGCLDRFTRQ
jgi:hypothetical protein